MTTEILNEKKEQKVLQIPSLKFFHKDPWEAWQILQEFLEKRGNPPYSIGGDVNLLHKDVKSLGNLISVGGYLYLKDTPIESLGNLTTVGGWMELVDTPIKSLGNLQSVGNFLDLRGTPIESLGNLRSVGDFLGLIYTPLSKKYTKGQIRQMVDVGGNIYM
jgi:hypothetical protein